MALRMAAEASDRVAAVAAIAATVSEALTSLVPPMPVPILFMNGTADPIVPYDGGVVRALGRSLGIVRSTEESLAWWRQVNGCSDDARREEVPDEAVGDGARTSVVRYEHCSSGAPVVLYRIEGGGHAWPGGAAYASRALIGNVTGDFDGAEAIMAFFAHFVRVP